MLALRPAVALAWIDHELDLAAGFDERVVELRRLRQRRAQVLLPVDDQRRGLHVARMEDGRPLRVRAVRIVRLALEKESVELADVRRVVEARPVGDDRVWNRGREAVRL